MQPLFYSNKTGRTASRNSLNTGKWQASHYTKDDGSARFSLNYFREKVRQKQKFNWSLIYNLDIDFQFIEVNEPSKVCTR